MGQCLGLLTKFCHLHFHEPRKSNVGATRNDGQGEYLLCVGSIERKTSGTPSPPNFLPDPILCTVIENVDNLSGEVSSGNSRYGSDGNPTLDPYAIGLETSMSGERGMTREISIRRLYPPP